MKPLTEPTNTDGVSPAPATQKAENPQPTPTPAPTEGVQSGEAVASSTPQERYRVTSNGSRNSRGRSSTGRRRPKRAKEPLSFNEWLLEDQGKYREVTIELRRWKATQRQCQYIRQSVGQWNQVKSVFKVSPLFKLELDVYKKTHKNIKPVPAGESFDLPPLN
ncbi:unnamed protein product [Bursaphelenchus xylophilus]|uniref:(pine wood nematode) hypothetical protein n=1 Tax=Bursaphelenchus xylophilus TaxID=6326 RepID=A0A1I7S3Q3_BURXY|nr:unnamed protein product [Bursaphelenchus xylophilus]CAG9116459.1 unnamed protein product [Bursaphelenchus xylophilus]